MWVIGNKRSILTVRCIPSLLFLFKNREQMYGKAKMAFAKALCHHVLHLGRISCLTNSDSCRIFYDKLSNKFMNLWDKPSWKNLPHDDLL